MSVSVSVSFTKSASCFVPSVTVCASQSEGVNVSVLGSDAVVSRSVPVYPEMTTSTSPEGAPSSSTVKVADSPSSTVTDAGMTTRSGSSSSIIVTLTVSVAERPPVAVSVSVSDSSLKSASCFAPIVTAFAPQSEELKVNVLGVDTNVSRSVSVYPEMTTVTSFAGALSSSTVKIADSPSPTSTDVGVTTRSGSSSSSIIVTLTVSVSEKLPVAVSVSVSDSSLKSASCFAVNMTVFSWSQSEEVNVSIIGVTGFRSNSPSMP